MIAGLLSGGLDGQYALGCPSSEMLAGRQTVPESSVTYKSRIHCFLTSIRFVVETNCVNGAEESKLYSFSAFHLCLWVLGEESGYIECHPKYSYTILSPVDFKVCNSAQDGTDRHEEKMHIHCNT